MRKPTRINQDYLPDELKEMFGPDRKAPIDFLFHPAELDHEFMPDSPIEARIMLNILETSPGIDITARYGLDASYEEIKDFVLMASNEPKWTDCMVFPQATVGPYRVDFIIAVRRPLQPRPNRYRLFIVEADGAAYHSATPEQVKRDIARQAWLVQHTGMDVLRFSGAEILYAVEVVGRVMEGFVESVLPDVYCRDGSRLARARSELLGLSRRLAALPAARPHYVNWQSARDIEELRRLLREIRDAEAEPPEDGGSCYDAGAEQDEDCDPEAEEHRIRAELAMMSWQIDGRRSR